MYCDDIEGSHPSGAFSLLPSFVRTQRLQAANNISNSNSNNNNANTAQPAPLTSQPTILRSAAHAPGDQGGTPSMRASATNLHSADLSKINSIGHHNNISSHSASKKGSPIVGSPRIGTPRSARATPRDGGNATSPAINKQLLAALNA